MRKKAQAKSQITGSLTTPFVCERGQRAEKEHIHMLFGGLEPKHQMTMVQVCVCFLLLQLQ